MNAVFKALNDPTRRQILDMLRQGDRTAGDIADQFDMTKPSISHHLDLLRQADLVSSVKEGQFIRYTLNTTVFDEVLGWLMALRQPANPQPADESPPETTVASAQIDLQPTINIL
jgi:ArsR family transcriptional regulator, arsenate/arsenite/antimonite-responsive transcriptional repressor